MEKYFYKLVDNIDFVWKINTHVLDPYKKGEMDFGHYVSNQRVFNPYLFESLADFQDSAFFSDYKEIEADMVNEETCYYDRSIGLLHTDDYWTNLHAHRNVPCLGKITPIVFSSTAEQSNVISNNDRERYLKLMACGPEVGQAIYLRNESEKQKESGKESEKQNESGDTACVVFRPSWDPEHGLAILINLDSKEVTLYED